MSTRSLNKVMLIGNLTRDPEMRYTPNGAAVCSFGIATNRSWQPTDGGERREETEFHRIVAWNKLAELCSQLLSKGRKVYIEGRLQTRSWEGPEGEKRQATEIVAEDMVLLDSRRDFASGADTGEERTEETSSVGSESQEVASGVKETEGKEEKEEKGKKSKGKKEEKEPASKDEAEEKPKEDSDEINIDDIPF
ncbi:MAG TPA: single-stranded DNA-binding protein [Candidatus Nanoarchaeia archaeon]|nr:plasmid-derived single-stranded DNA-binding protein [uncultured archaeon]